MANTRQQPVAVNRLGIERVRVNERKTPRRRRKRVCVELTVLDHHSGTAIKSTKSCLITQQLFKEITSVPESNVGVIYKLQVNTNLGMH